MFFWTKNVTIVQKKLGGNYEERQIFETDGIPRMSEALTP